MKKPTCETCVVWEEIEDGIGDCHDDSAGRYSRGTFCPEKMKESPFPFVYYDNFCRKHQDFPAYLESLKEENHNECDGSFVNIRNLSEKDQQEIYEFAIERSEEILNGKANDD